ncbi:MAG: hypothetical protein QM733_17575 [Ilumatobacteraceae bacterium]
MCTTPIRTRWHSYAATPQRLSSAGEPSSTPAPTTSARCDDRRRSRSPGSAATSRCEPAWIAASSLAPSSSFRSTTGGTGAHDGWSAGLEDGTEVHARRVVWAGNPRRRLAPAGVELGGRVVHGSVVDVGEARPGERIAVLGAGQTAGQLAVGADLAGAHVALISRGPQRIADLDIDAGWLMDDHLTPFGTVEEPASAAGSSRRRAEAR